MMMFSSFVGKPADSGADLGESALSGGPRHLAWRQEDSAAGWGKQTHPEDFKRTRVEELSIPTWILS